MSLIYTLLYTLLLSFFSLEIFVYPGVVEKHLHINPSLFLFLYIAFFLTYSLWRPPKLKFYNYKTNKIILLSSIILFLFSFFIEKITYPNFVFSHFKFHFPVFIKFIFLSLTNFYISQTPKENIKKIFYLTPAILFLVFFLIEKYYSQTFINLFQEDGVAEYTQFLLYAFSSYFFYKNFTLSKGKTKIIFLFLFIALFFIAGEEISWGQRILGIETPDAIKEINYQDELTLHNLNFIQVNLLHPAYMITGLLGSLSYFFFKLFFPKSKLTIFIPETFLFFGFFFTFLFYFSYDFYIVPNQISYGNVPLVRWQEVTETFLSFSFFGHAYNIHQKLLHQSQNRKPGKKQNH